MDRLLVSFQIVVGTEILGAVIGSALIRPSVPRHMLPRQVEISRFIAGIQSDTLVIRMILRFFLATLVLTPHWVPRSNLIVGNPTGSILGILGEDRVAVKGVVALIDMEGLQVAGNALASFALTSGRIAHHALCAIPGISWSASPVTAHRRLWGATMIMESWIASRFHGFWTEVSKWIPGLRVGIHIDHFQRWQFRVLRRTIKGTKSF